MRLTANVRRITGLTTHFVTVEQGAPLQFEHAINVEIVEGDGGFLLIRYSPRGFAGDTWHPSVEEAKRQAEAEFAVSSADWREDHLIGEP